MDRLKPEFQHSSVQEEDPTATSNMPTHVNQPIREVHETDEMSFHSNHNRNRAQSLFSDAMNEESTSNAQGKMYKDFEKKFLEGMI